MIYLFTDFGYHGPYVGEVHAVLKRRMPDIPIIDLMHDAPVFNPMASSYLLAALALQFQAGDVCLAVVDPGVGMQERRALLIEADGITYCGPDNGLLSQVVQRAHQVSCHEILWHPTDLSNSFHGRDLFAPALVRYLAGSEVPLQSLASEGLHGMDWPAENYSVIYFDQFGNSVTGIRGTSLTPDMLLHINETKIDYARTFASVPAGQLFWYSNSMGLVEVAVNQGSAREKLAISLNFPISVSKKTG